MRLWILALLLMLFLEAFGLVNWKVMRRTKKKPTCGVKALNSLYPPSEPTGVFHILNDGNQNLKSARNEWPWVVQIRKSAGNDPNEHKFGKHSSRCGGTLIEVCSDGKTMKSDIVVTAAHCASWKNNKTKFWKDNRPAEIVVLAGHHHDKDATPQVKVKEVHVHETWNRWGDDIAILVLEKPLSLITRHGSPVIYPLCMPVGKTPLTDTWKMKTCYTAGWGALVENVPAKEMKPSPYLQHARMKVKLQKKCFELHKMTNSGISEGPATAQLLCSIPSDEKSFFASGDSGGPLMCKEPHSGLWTLQGVNSESFVLRETNQSIANKYIRINYYLTWIEQKVKTRSSLCKTCGVGTFGKIMRNKGTCNWRQFNPDD